MRLANVVLAAVRILMWSLMFLAVFAGLALGVAAMLAWLRGDSLGVDSNLYLGLVCGLVVCLFVAVFHLRRESLQLTFSDRDTFVGRLKMALHEMGYELVSQTSEHLRFKPGFQAFLLGGGIGVKLETALGTVTGPRLTLEALRHRLRLQQHLDIVQQSFHDSRRRQGDPLLKRVQLTVRLPSKGWSEVVGHLEKALNGEATLVADLHLLLQTSRGIPESVIDQNVRAWLQERGVAVDIHKNHVQMPRSTQEETEETELPHLAAEVTV